jgi:hypothetical protein
VSEIELFSSLSVMRFTKRYSERENLALFSGYLTVFSKLFFMTMMMEGTTDYIVEPTSFEMAGLMLNRLPLCLGVTAGFCLILAYA